MPRVSLKDFYALRIMISQYVFVPRTYENDSDHWAVIDDPHVVAATRRDLEHAAKQCAAGYHRTLGCDCSLRSHNLDREMLVLVQVS